MQWRSVVLGVCMCADWYAQLFAPYAPCVLRSVCVAYVARCADVVHHAMRVSRHAGARVLKLISLSLSLLSQSPFVVGPVDWAPPITTPYLRGPSLPSGPWVVATLLVPLLKRHSI